MWLLDWEWGGRRWDGNWQDESLGEGGWEMGGWAHGWYVQYRSRSVGEGQGNRGTGELGNRGAEEQGTWDCSDGMLCFSAVPYRNCTVPVGRTYELTVAKY